MAPSLLTDMADTWPLLPRSLLTQIGEHWPGSLPLDSVADGTSLSAVVAHDGSLTFSASQARRSGGNTRDFELSQTLKLIENLFSKNKRHHVLSESKS